MNDATQREILDIENRIAESLTKGDTEIVSRVWADDFFYTGVRGEVKGKKEILADFKAGIRKFDWLRFDDVRVQVYGETAVVTGRATTKGQSAQGEITGEFRYTRIYVKRGGAWQVVAFQGTPIVKA
jgi:uncharacterized protein (TIGR02246 family)